MASNPFRVLGAEVPALLGRRRLVEKIQSHLEQDPPDHLTVVGPAMCGKSVLLREIVRQYADGRPGYEVPVYVDLRHGKPRTDDELRRRVAEELKLVLERTRPEVAEYLALEDVEIRERMQLTTQELHDKGDRVLLVMDGFDDVVANPGITREIWDNLRAVAARKRLRFVTGSRRPLRELCRDEDARTADFWEVFYDSPVVVGPFADEDREALFGPFEATGRKLDAAAREAIGRWTWGVPVLAAAFLQSLYDSMEPGESAGVEEVDRIAATVLDQRRELLHALWEDCPAELKADLADLSARDLRLSELTEGRVRDLEQRGFVERTGKKVRFACRLMQKFVAGEAAEVSGLQRLFGDTEHFDHNIRMLLEMRLAQVPRVDDELHGYVEQAIRHLQPEPRHSIVWLRSIVDRALDLIWQKELGNDTALPKSWLAEWERAGIRNPPDDGYGRLPGERGRQMHVLRMAAGTGVRGVTVRRVSRYASRPTAILLEHLLAVGNFGQHQGDVINRPFAVSVCLTAITLAANLAADLGAES